MATANIGSSGKGKSGVLVVEDAVSPDKNKEFAFCAKCDQRMTKGNVLVGCAQQPGNNGFRVNCPLLTKNK